jgi:hypothetical protein
MGVVYNPLLQSGLQFTGATGGGGGGNAFFKDPVADVASLPVSGADGEMRVVLDTDSIYIYDMGSAGWKLVTDPLTDLRQITAVVPDSATLTNVPGFLFSDTVKSAMALVSVTTVSTGDQETVVMELSRGNTVPQGTESRTGDITPVVFDVVLSGSAMQVQYQTVAGAETYEISFRAITLT